MSGFKRGWRIDRHPLAGSLNVAVTMTKADGADPSVVERAGGPRERVLIGRHGLGVAQRLAVQLQAIGVVDQTVQ